MSSRAVRALYRLFLRQARALERNGVAQLDVRAPISKEAWLMQQGGHGWAPPRDEFHLRSLQQLFPWAAEGATSGSFSPAQLRALITRCFRQPAGASKEEQLDQAFTSLRLLSDQIHMQECSSSCQTEGVHVEVTTAHVGSQEDLDPHYEPEEGQGPKQYYTYRVRVSNCGDQAVQLTGRHWIIEDAGGNVVTEVAKGSRGVVGCTPILKPGECFEYYSGTDVDTPGGRMRGSFQMAVVDPQRPQDLPSHTFDAEVAPFYFVPAGGGA
ncbi:hypothetical protein ABPG77_009271 [Micractinium sp. CCAP 211/92]